MAALTRQASTGWNAPLAPTADMDPRAVADANWPLQQGVEQNPGINSPRIVPDDWWATNTPGVDPTQGPVLSGPGAPGGSTLANMGGNVPQGATGQYASGSAIAPWTQQFQAPTAQQAIGSPGMEYALSRAQQAIERGAAAKGTLLTGGTLRDLSENQIGMALQGYGDVYNRARSEYDLSKSTFQENQDRPFSKYATLAELGKPS